ncbi:hypothetical protein AX17_004956 [Amanita inopinata Kibby_2008]|nr:hypothetical protein AX17_004956 [Amanita inopinata Kibby_2008]
MNSSLQDPSKKASITSLLNPQDTSIASNFPTPQRANFVPPSAVGHGQAPPHSEREQSVTPAGNGVYATHQRNNSASFHLRAAEWDNSGTRRRPLLEHGASPQHAQFPEPSSAHLKAPIAYSDLSHDARVARQRMDDPVRYPGQGQMWVAQQDPTGMSYVPATTMPPHSSIEREPLSGGYPPPLDYSQPYHHQQQDGVSEQYSNWQSSERVSVRLAARGTAARGQPQHHYHQYQALDSRNGLVSYYGQHVPANVYGIVYQRQISQHSHQQQLTPPVSPGPQDVMQQRKRPSQEPHDEGAPKLKKRSRAKNPSVTGSQGPSKRGYNAKKRSVAAQIAAQNARLRALSGESSSLQPEMQFARCMSNRYKEHSFPRCVACTRRWAGDTCRFQGIRFFLKDFEEMIVGISFVESSTTDGPVLDFPKRWNKPLKCEHVRNMKIIIAKSLLPTLHREMEHLKLPEIIRRPRETDVRTTCDTCMTSIFSCSWICRICGREACAECFAKVVDFTRPRPDATPEEQAAAQVRRERHAHINPSFLSCTRRNEHQAKDFSPMSRFCNEELTKAIEEMEAVLQKERNRLNSGESHPIVIDDDENSDVEIIDLTDTAGIPDSPAPEPAYLPTNLSDITASTPFHELRRIHDDALTSANFDKIWTVGEPFVVTNVQRKLKLKWTPEYFIEKYGKESCLIIECQSDTNKRVTVEQFFGRFGNYEDRRESWKLKDWPSSTEFKSAFPGLYDDFSQAVPVPDFVRRDGVMNMSSHFPVNVIAPDLGPKMYNAMASSLAEGSKGSTRLHMDMADALNIMAYAPPCADGSPGCAAWDLFRPEDSDKLRGFLRGRVQGIGIQDPIHSQQTYLDEVLLKELWETCGVKSYRLYQRPGEAIFIPAGCAHQVANLSDCIKVAIDFVSPDNVSRCEQLTQEFREQNQGLKWKEDVLQLRTMMWFAWLSCRHQEEEWQKKRKAVAGDAPVEAHGPAPVPAPLTATTTPTATPTAATPVIQGTPEPA